MEDSAIIELYWNREEAAISETSKKYGNYCTSIAYGILGDWQDTEECVNDAYLKVWNAIPPARPDVFRLFLAKITRNLAFDKYKAKTAKKRGGDELTAVLAELDECVTGSSYPEKEFEAKELAAAIERFLDTLGAREHDIFLHRYFYAESVAELAGRYRLKESNIHMILSRTRKKLKNYLKKEGYHL